MTDVVLTFNSRICGGILVLGAFAGALGLSPMSNLQAALLLLVCVMLATASRTDFSEHRVIVPLCSKKHGTSPQLYRERQRDGEDRKTERTERQRERDSEPGRNRGAGRSKERARAKVQRSKPTLNWRS